MVVERTLAQVMLLASKQLYSCYRVMDGSPNKPTDLVMLANYDNVITLCSTFHKCAEYLANYLTSVGGAALCKETACQNYYLDLARMGQSILEMKTTIKTKTAELLKLVHLTALALLKVAPKHRELIEVCSCTSALPRILRLVAEQQRAPESLGLLTLATLSSLAMPAAHVHGGSISCVAC
jgi:hypothetical protein